MEYWYDEQLRRYLLQFMRIFGGFQVKEGKRDGVEYYNKVPVRYADMSRMVSHLLRKGSENLVGSTPFISCSISSLLIARDRAADPLLVDKVQISERQFDQSTQQYRSSTEEDKFPGNLYTTDRYMPVDEAIIKLVQCLQDCFREGEKTIRDRYRRLLFGLDEPRYFVVDGSQIFGTVRGVTVENQLVIEVNGTTQLFDVQEIKWLL